MSIDFEHQVREARRLREKHLDEFAAAYFKQTGIPPGEAVFMQREEGSTIRWWFERKGTRGEGEMPSRGFTKVTEISVSKLKGRLLEARLNTCMDYNRNVLAHNNLSAINRQGMMEAFNKVWDWLSDQEIDKLV